jgi:hypothetical protein
MENSITKIFEGQEIKVTTDKGITLINLACTARVCGLTTVAKSRNEVVRWKGKGSVFDKLEKLRDANVSIDERYIEEISSTLDEIENTDDRNTIYMSNWLSKRLALECHSEKAGKYKTFLVTLDEDFQSGKLFGQGNDSLELINQQVGLVNKQVGILMKKSKEHDNRLGELENNMTIDYAQQEELNRYGRTRVVQALGGKEAPAYKMLHNKAFSRFWNDYKEYLKVNSYKNTAVKDIDKGYDFINKWEPNEDLSLMIRGANAQTRIIDKF